jgi:pyridoxal phosphate enzyme (YggS family)
VISLHDLINIQHNLKAIHSHILEYVLRYQRKPGSVRLVAVSKGQPPEKILAAKQAGQHAFAENYLQEALVKILILEKENLEWHFIGPLQVNKIKQIAQHFRWVHSVSSFKMAERLNNRCPYGVPPINICLQVNTSGEVTKSGILPDALEELATQCLTLPRIRLRGLMCIPAPKNTLAEQRAELNKLQVLQKKLVKKGLKLDTLSMGMSDDLEAAIAEGATLVRIGTKIFGKR